MKLIVAGGRYYTNYNFVRKTLDYFLSKTSEPIQIISGACDTGKHTFTRKDGTKVFGVDGLGERYAEERGYEVTPFPAQWGIYGKAAGPIRNGEMAGVATHAVLFWDGESRGTQDMYEKALDRKLKTKLVKCYD